MKNFFEEQRNALDLNETQMAARAGVTAGTVRLWDRDAVLPTAPIATLATAYEVSESRMEREVMALRRRIEARKAAQPAKKKLVTAK